MGICYIYCFHPEDGGSVSFRKLTIHILDYTVSYPTEMRHLHPEDADSMVFWNFPTPLPDYTVS
jgi:hypothetical protein